VSATTSRLARRRLEAVRPDRNHGAVNHTAYADASAAAARAMEAYRELSYGTQLSFPADVSEVLNTLEMTAELLPVICGQLAAWLDDEAEGARLQAQDGPFAGDVPAAVATTIQWLTRTAELADEMRLALGNACVAAGGLVSAGNEDEAAPSNS
jgi:hypothetical protein